jgi:hypothetical protein
MYLLLKNIFHNPFYRGAPTLYHYYLHFQVHNVVKKFTGSKVLLNHSWIYFSIVSGPGLFGSSFLRMKLLMIKNLLVSQRGFCKENAKAPFHNSSFQNENMLSVSRSKATIRIFCKSLILVLTISRYNEPSRVMTE